MRGAVDFYAWVAFLVMACFYWLNFNSPQPEGGGGATAARGELRAAVGRRLRAP